VRGAALSNVVAQGLGGVFALWILFSGRTRIIITFKNFHFDRNIIWRTVKIGLPSSITSVKNFAGHFGMDHSVRHRGRGAIRWR
jgi:Na+-driven multidrug efflux pump